MIKNKFDLIKKIESELYRDELKGDEYLELEEIEEIIKKYLGENCVMELVYDDEDCDFDLDVNFDCLNGKFNDKCDNGFKLDDVVLINGRGISGGINYGNEYSYYVLVYVFK